MSHTNRSILEKANAAIRNGNFDGFLSYCTEDICWDMVGGEKFQGRAAVRDWMQKTYVEPPVFDIENSVEEEDRLVVYGKIEVIGANGTPVRSRYCDVWRIRDGRLAELQAYAVEIEN